MYEFAASLPFSPIIYLNFFAPRRYATTTTTWVESKSRWQKRAIARALIYSRAQKTSSRPIIWTPTLPWIKSRSGRGKHLFFFVWVRVQIWIIFFLIRNTKREDLFWRPVIYCVISTLSYLAIWIKFVPRNIKNDTFYNKILSKWWNSRWSLQAQSIYLKIKIQTALLKILYLTVVS